MDSVVTLVIKYCIVCLKFARRVDLKCSQQKEREEEGTKGIGC